MSDAPASSSRAETAEALFAEYLAARDEGRATDVEALCARAGHEAAELRSRLRAYAVLLDLGAALRCDDDPEPIPDPTLVGGARLGRYENLRLLGEGGLSRVYVARDPELERDVALKVIATEHVSIEAARAWIRQEGRTLARLAHPGVVQVFDTGEADGLTYVAMDLVHGPSLAEVLDELRARREREAVRSEDPRIGRAADELAGIGARASLALAIGRALAACHAGGVLHRDVKPGNVLIEAGLQPKLIDFGLAHLEEAGGSLNQVTQRLIGTPAYISPEQVESGRTGADPRSDQFSFGVLLYELLTLTTPFQRSTRTATLDAVALALPVQPKKLDAAIPADLETICLHALERDPRDRYPSMSALVDDLAAFIDHRAIAISPPSVGRRLRMWSRRNRRDILVFGAPAFLVLGGLAANHAIAVRRDAARLADRIADARVDLSGAKDPIAIQSAFQSAREIELDADQQARRFFAAQLVPHVARDAAHLIRLTSDRLHELIRNDRDAIATLKRQLLADAEDKILHRWESALTFDAALCPDCPANAEDRERGRVELPSPPPGTRLVISQAKPGSMPFLLDFSELEGVRSLTDGDYRVEWTDD